MNLLDSVTRERTVGGRDAPPVLDWLVALTLVAIAVLEIGSGVLPGPVGIAAAAQLAATVPVAFRRVAPLPAIAVSATVSLPYVLVYGTDNGAGGSVASAGVMLLLIYSVGRHTHGRRLLAGAACSLLLTVEPVIGRPAGPSDVVVMLILLVATLGLGMAIRVQTERSIGLAVTADRARGNQEATAEAAVREERARIARELHDVVAHNVGLIVLQAGGARSVLARDPDRARAALQQVEETGRQTLVEMRHLVGSLRIDEAVGLQPLPCLERVPALIDAFRATGLAVDLHVMGPVVGLPAGLELAAYRLIEEGLTNVHKHAPTARAEVRLNYGRDGLRIEVRDDGGPSPAAIRVARPAPGLGFGLIGMRERVNLYGGRMEAGPMSVRGFRVEAILPISLVTS